MSFDYEYLIECMKEELATARRWAKAWRKEVRSWQREYDLLSEDYDRLCKNYRLLQEEQEVFRQMLLEKNPGEWFYGPARAAEPLNGWDADGRPVDK
jgi:hypothetical protein